MNDIVLAGCRLEPLGSYLKALGVLRLLGEQADRDATGRWKGDEFVIGTALDEAALVEFFLDRYRPTPLVAPWNGRSGFDPEDERPASGQRLRTFEESRDPRCSAYRETIAIARRVVAHLTASGLSRDKAKPTWVEACRGALPDDAVRWLDAVAVLTATGDVKFPVVLGGAGGVLGSMDLTGNFLLHLGSVLRVGPRPLSTRDVEALLRLCLFSRGTAKLMDASAGAFYPGAAGDDALVNPWDFVLLLEGALLFASAAARRFGGDSRSASPFMVATTVSGFGSRADGERTRGELWAPVWRRPASLVELDRFMGEGRASWSGHQARDGLDFVRAAASLGVDRGVDEFVRHVFVERLGQSLIAVPVARVKVRHVGQVPLLSQLDRWLRSVRLASPPSSIATALRRVDDAQFTLAHEGSPAALRAVLARVAELEALVARSKLANKDKVSRPLGGLVADEWLAGLDDGSAEYRVAVALASQREAWLPGQSDKLRDQSRFAFYLRRVRLTDDGKAIEWAADRSVISDAASARPLIAILSALLASRAVDAITDVAAGLGFARDDVLVPQCGGRTAFRMSRSAPLSDVVALVDGALDERALLQFLYGLILVGQLPLGSPEEGDLPRVIPAGYALLAPFFAGHPVRRGGRDGSSSRIQLRTDQRWTRLLNAGRVNEVIAGGLARLRVAGFDPVVRSAEQMALAIDSTRLAAALAIPVSARSSQACIDMICPPESTVPSASTREEASPT